MSVAILMDLTDPAARTVRAHRQAVSATAQLQRAVTELNQLKSQLFKITSEDSKTKAALEKQVEQVSSHVDQLASAKQLALANEITANVSSNAVSSVRFNRDPNPLF